MKRINRIDMAIKSTSLKDTFGFPDYSPHEYPCPKCGTQLKLKQKRVLYCKFCRKGKLHPRFNFKKDSII